MGMKKQLRPLTFTLLLLFLVPALVLGIVGCKSTEEKPEPAAPEPTRFDGKPEVEIKNVEVTEITAEKITLRSLVRLRNPYPVDIALASYRWELHIGDTHFLSDSRDKRLKLPSKESVQIDFSLPIGYKKLLETKKQLDSKKSNKAEYSLFVHTEIETPIGKGTIGVDTRSEGSFPLFTTPRISIKEVIVTEFSNVETDLVFMVEMTNPNVFSIELHPLSFTIDVNEEEWISGKTKKSYSMDPGESTTISVPLTVNNVKIGVPIFDLLISDEKMDYRIYGSSSLSVESEKIRIREFPFSFDTEGGAGLFRP